MPRRRFFVPRDKIRNGVAILPPDQFHHLFNVLRIGPGDEIEIFDGEGASYLGEVSNIGPEIHVRKIIQAAGISSAGCHITLAIALIKAERFEWMLQKATELGVWEFAPLVTRHSEISISGTRLAARMERWRRIVREASKQCRRLNIPHICEPDRFENFLNSGRGQDFQKLMLYEKAPASRGLRISQSEQACLCIGPEGGWDQQEVADAEEVGYQIFSLGDRILRSETAAIAAVSIIQFLVGELGN